ncbi:hypothetical protein LUZ60_017605 [Juncus effusus]|nr:hypothetical protein LUZ60_017605 [Juncus effusus]
MNVVHTCMASAKFTIIFNGTGDGFFKPKCGLRQGSPLSPYMFILGMDVLARSLLFAAHSGFITGIELTPSSPTLTHRLYANDLVLYGESSTQEAERFLLVLHMFEQVSGQSLNLAKSKLWFSKATNEALTEDMGGRGRGGGTNSPTNRKNTSETSRVKKQIPLPCGSPSANQEVPPSLARIHHGN